jgi:hypothetical protein
MSDFEQPLLSTWRAAVASKHGPRGAVTRLVCLTLSFHMDDLAEGRYPSLELLAEETGLGLRTVKEHMAVAVAAGWIGKRDRREPNGQGWRRVSYVRKIPAAVRARFHDKQRGAADSRPRGGELVAREVAG